jgi:hypothetical protein
VQNIFGRDSKTFLGDQNHCRNVTWTNNLFTLVLSNSTTTLHAPSAMATAVSTTPAVNGQSDGKLKAKSKNQLRRLKQKQKKAAGLNGTESAVRSPSSISYTNFLNL